MTKAKYTNEEMVGKKFGKLTLIEETHEKRYSGDCKRWRWTCKCDCGKIVKRLSGNVYSGKTTSCGCTRKPRDYKPVNFEGFGELSGKYYNRLRSQTRRTSCKDFNVTIEYLWNLFLQQNKRCSLSGVEIKFGRDQRQYKNEQTASLDRIDSSKGYVVGNVQWVHKDINYMKRHYPQNYFINTCKLIAKTQESQSHKSDEQVLDKVAANLSRPVGLYL